MQKPTSAPPRGPPPALRPASAVPLQNSSVPAAVGSSAAGAAAGGTAAAEPGKGAVPPVSTRAAEVALAQQALDLYSEAGGRYRLHKLIGKGAYGAVYIAYDHADPAAPRKVAIKHIVNAFVSPTDARRIYREIKVMAHFNHPNILALTEVIKPRDAAGFSHIYLVSELMETDLHRVIHSRQDLTSDHISYFVYQTLCALKHIHTAGVLHRDLKPSNLLVNSDCTVRMCDFGLARESEPSMSAAFTEYVVTRWYRAPEVLLSGGKYKTSVDVWSVGCVLAEMLQRRPLFPGENYLHQLQLVTELLGSPSDADLHFVRSEAARAFMLRLPRFEPVPLASVFPHVRGPCLDLLARMLTFDPEARISVDDALSHPFLARVRTARRHANEESVGVPRPFRLKVPGGSAGLKAMSVDAIKGRFYGELCGVLVSPTPTSAPAGPLFPGGGAITLAGGGAAAAGGGAADVPVSPAAATASASAAHEAAMVETPSGARAPGPTAVAGPEDRPPHEWRASGGRSGGASSSGGMEEDEDEWEDWEDAAADTPAGATTTAAGAGGGGGGSSSGSPRRPRRPSAAEPPAAAPAASASAQKQRKPASSMDVDDITSGIGAAAVGEHGAAAARAGSAAVSRGGAPRK